MTRWPAGSTREKALGIRGGTLFCTLQGGAVSDQYVRDALHRLGRRAGSVSPTVQYFNGT